MALDKEQWMLDIEKNLYSDRDFMFICQLGRNNIPKPDLISTGVFSLLKKNKRINVSMNRRYRWAQ